ncbi:hypothetical protein J6590_007166 [Homalodisca vitripennis]|nr:hypothetical protein J6590_007166 [Homalodisca vitripennis]
MTSQISVAFSPIARTRKCQPGRGLSDGESERHHDCSRSPQTEQVSRLALAALRSVDYRTCQSPEIPEIDANQEAVASSHYIRYWRELIGALRFGEHNHFQEVLWF